MLLESMCGDFVSTGYAFIHAVCSAGDGTRRDVLASSSEIVINALIPLGEQ